MGKLLNFSSSYDDLGLRLRMEDIDTIQDELIFMGKVQLANYLAPISLAKVNSYPSLMSGITGVVSVEYSTNSGEANRWTFYQNGANEYMLSPIYADCWINTTNYGLCRVEAGTSTSRAYGVDGFWIMYVYERKSEEIKDVKIRNHYIHKENIIFFNSGSSNALTDTLIGTLKIGNPQESFPHGSLGEIVFRDELKTYLGMDSKIRKPYKSAAVDITLSTTYVGTETLIYFAPYIPSKNLDNVNFIVANVRMANTATGKTCRVDFAAGDDTGVDSWDKVVVEQLGTNYSTNFNKQVLIPLSPDKTATYFVAQPNAYYVEPYSLTINIIGWI